MNKILVDTNVFVYAADRESRYHLWSNRILTSSDFDCYTTSKNLLELMVVLTRGENPSLSIKEAISIIKYIRSSYNVLYPDPLSMDQYLELADKSNPKGLACHDFEIAAIGLSNEINQIATVNQKDFIRIKELTVVSPEDN